MPQQLGIDTRSQTEEQTHTVKKNIKNVNVSQDNDVKCSDSSG